MRGATGIVWLDIKKAHHLIPPVGGFGKTIILEEHEGIVSKRRYRFFLIQRKYIVLVEIDHFRLTSKNNHETVHPRAQTLADMCSHPQSRR